MSVWETKSLVSSINFIMWWCLWNNIFTAMCRWIHARTNPHTTRPDVLSRPDPKGMHFLTYCVTFDLYDKRESFGIRSCGMSNIGFVSVHVFSVVDISGRWAHSWRVCVSTCSRLGDGQAIALLIKIFLLCYVFTIFVVLMKVNHLYRLETVLFC